VLDRLWALKLGKRLFKDTTLGLQRAAIADLQLDTGVTKRQTVGSYVATLTTLHH